jgi:hypothetical protein
VRIAQGLDGGKTYWLHTYSTDPTNDVDQRETTALNNFAIWATAGARVYGVGAMEAYIRLPGGRASEFYMSQIDDEHAGKTMIINLWDPGDTGALAARLQILAPGATNYSPIPFTWEAAPNSGNATNCTGSGASSPATDPIPHSVTTNTGGNSLYNGCWLEITIPLDEDYDAPHPSSDTVTTEGGWWKIRYNMSGASSDFSTDLTTWQVELRGNPVHLVME